jgi:hypothetical protein
VSFKVCFSLSGAPLSFCIFSSALVSPVIVVHRSSNTLLIISLACSFLAGAFSPLHI